MISVVTGEEEGLKEKTGNAQINGQEEDGKQHWKTKTPIGT
jgi:hypothetical protein